MVEQGIKAEETAWTRNFADLRQIRRGQGRVNTEDLD